ncbi:MAG TPA: cyclase family protein [Bryobacteraceae bacterium]|jgi:kynurenine formamidase|nr:cyclase family protein [Bryobacteraceae bacterium]
MRAYAGSLVVLLLLVLSADRSSSQAVAPAKDHTVTAAQYERWKKDLSNWGRWGKDDQIGALNLITPAKRRQAAALVKEGFSVSMEADPDTVKAVDNPNPFELKMLTIGSDEIAVNYHGIAHTHLDSLAHINDNGVFFNGYKPDAATVLKQGHAKNSIHNVKNGIFTRGILIDIPRLKGVPYLEPGTPIYVEDLEAWEKKAGIKVSAGDALFVRTGVWARRKAVGPWLRGRAEGGRSAGLDPSVIPWLKQRDIAIMGSDHPQYVSPSSLRGAVHDFALLYLGVHLFDNCDLEALADAAAARNRWDFLLTAAPLAIPGGTGSPVNPIATF